MMKRLLILIIFLLSVVPVQGGNNITQKAVYLSQRVVVVKFVNMGVDAHWGTHILDNAATALPLLEELIGAPLPPQIESVEIYGRKDLGEEWLLGYNDGNLVALAKDHPDPTIVFHELTHFWTIYYNIPWGLAEGYSNLYADLCAAELGYDKLIYSNINWAAEYAKLKDTKAKAPLNNMDYMNPALPEDQRAYFYSASTIIMFNLYETVGEENLKAINLKVSQSSLDGRRGGTGIIHYIGIVRDVTKINYAGLFMPIIFTEWEEENVKSFENAVGRYYAVSELTGIPDSDETMSLALNALLNGKIAEFRSQEQAMVTDFYAQQMQPETLPPHEIVYPEKERGFFSNTLLIAGIIILVVVVAALIFVISKLAKEEEEFEWEERPLKEGPAVWGPPEQEFPEEIEELPELPDLEGLTK